jgi:hypothetical protein
MRIVRCTVAACLLTAAAAAPAQEDPAMIMEARKLASSMQSNLAAKLLAEIKAGGPASAIGVCTTVAPKVATDLSRERGWRLTRVSLRVRNPVLGTPDAWEQRVLQAFDERVAKREKSEGLEFAETVTEPGGKYFRYMKALPVQPLCLDCHGTPDKIAPGVKERLAKDYPHDKATGYSIGQIRGAISIKRPL